ncbi:MAG TPA: response regulator transcription factor [Gaiellaceae bacterium]|jgi:DNA-binding NarL/FixJ family response regulator
MQRIRVVIVEDNKLFRETLELLFGMREELDVVASVSGGAEGIEICGTLAPDVAVVDYRMPGIDGAQATAKLLEISPGTSVICLTASVSAEERELVLRAGARLCLTKDERLDRIVEAILEVAGARAEMR